MFHKNGSRRQKKSECFMLYEKDNQPLLALKMAEDQKPRSMGSLQKLENVRKEILP